MEGQAAHEVQAILDMINTSIRCFKGTIADLTEIVKLQSLPGQEEGPIGLLETIQEIELDLMQQIEAAKAELVLDISPEAEVSFSRKNLKSILYNLLSNAIKYRSPERKPFIRLSSKEEGWFTLLCVGDNGLGIKEKDKEKVFGMFQRANSKVEGSGIGLFIVKRTIENAGGSISLKSEEGKGSEFRVYFPK